MLQVYNRWGNIVYETTFPTIMIGDGTSNGRATVQEGDLLPVGTYYYVLDLGDGSAPRTDWFIHKQIGKMGIIKIKNTQRMKRQFRTSCFVALLMGTMTVSAQQDPQFTQYMYNTLNVNPAYAGSRGHLTALLLHRSQWVGVNGAPTTQVLAVDGPMGKQCGAWIGTFT